MEIEWIESQFFEANKIANNMIIIHHTGSQNGVINSFAGTISWFKPDVWRSTGQVSAQYIIARNERSIVQMVSDEHTAWHAGRSEWVIDGVLRKNVNNRSIGIELQGDGNLTTYTEFQYEALIWLVKQKMREHNIPVDLIRGHQEVSSHKVDPGQHFNWDRFRRALSSVSVPGGNILDDNVSDSDLVDTDGDGIIYLDENENPIPNNQPTDTDGDGIIYLDETDDVQIPSGRDQSLLGQLFSLLGSFFK